MTGVAPGCGYDNPGFKLKDSDPESDSAAQTTSVSGVTMMTTTETPTTSTSTTGTTEPMTTQGPGVSGSETSTSTGVDPTTETTTETTTGTTGEPAPWDAVCADDELITAKPVFAAADAFFQFQGEGAGPKGCSIGLGDDLQDPKCVDRNTGAMTFLPLVSLLGPPNTPGDDLVNVFGVRFDVPVIETDDGPVPPEAFVKAELGVSVFRGTQKLPMLDVYPMGPGMPWMEGDNGASTPCMPGEPTFRCRACGEAYDGPCAEAWKYGTVFNPKDPDGKLIGTMETMVEQNAKGVATFLLPTEHLHRAFEGLIISAQPDLVAGEKFEVKTLNAGGSNIPTLTITYCSKPKL